MSTLLEEELPMILEDQHELDTEQSHEPSSSRHRHSDRLPRVKKSNLRTKTLVSEMSARYLTDFDEYDSSEDEEDADDIALKDLKVLAEIGKSQEKRHEYTRSQLY